MNACAAEGIRHGGVEGDGAVRQRRRARVPESGPRGSDAGGGVAADGGVNHVQRPIVQHAAADAATVRRVHACGVSADGAVGDHQGAVLAINRAAFSRAADGMVAGQSTVTNGEIAKVVDAAADTFLAVGDREI